MPANDEDHPIVTLLSVLGALASAVLLAWWTVIAFVGGTMPIIGVETEGGFGNGLFWLLFVDPIVATLLYWAFMLVMLPIIAIATWAKRGD